MRHLLFIPLALVVTGVAAFAAIIALSRPKPPPGRRTIGRNVNP